MSLSPSISEFRIRSNSADLAWWVVGGVGIQDLQFRVRVSVSGFRVFFRVRKNQAQEASLKITNFGTRVEKTLGFGGLRFFGTCSTLSGARAVTAEGSRLHCAQLYHTTTWIWGLGFGV